MSGLLIIFAGWIVGILLSTISLALMARLLQYPRRGFLRALGVVAIWMLLALVAGVFNLYLPNNVVGALLSLLCFGVILVLEVAIVHWLARAPLGKALAGWGVTIGVRIVYTIIVIIVVRGSVAEFFFAPALSMAPTLLSRHATASCQKCGGTVVFNTDEFAIQNLLARQPLRQDPRTVAIDGLCLSCRQGFQAPLNSLTSLLADHFMVVKILAPQRWDIVAYHRPNEIHSKRLIGMPGDTVSIDAAGHLFVNGTPESPPRGVPASFPWFDVEMLRSGNVKLALVPGATIQLGPDDYFVIGDNSAASNDSRLFGPIHRQDIIGVATTIYWPPSRVRILR